MGSSRTSSQKNTEEFPVEKFQDFFFTMTLRFRWLRYNRLDPFPNDVTTTADRAMLEKKVESRLRSAKATIKRHERLSKNVWRQLDPLNNNRSPSREEKEQFFLLMKKRRSVLTKLEYDRKYFRKLWNLYQDAEVLQPSWGNRENFLNNKHPKISHVLARV